MHLLIAAAGSGRRMGADQNKLLLPLLGRPVLAWTIDAALKAESITWIGIIGQPKDQSEIMKLIKGSNKEAIWINGGDSRQESVQRGLSALPNKANHVLIHDGARCLVEPSLFNECAELLAKGNSVIAATAVSDTIKKVNQKGMIIDTPNRDELWAAQTPQGFSVKELQLAHLKAQKNGWNVTDDASLFEKLGLPVRILRSGPSNIKVTTPFDLVVAEAVLSTRPKN